MVVFGSSVYLLRVVVGVGVRDAPSCSRLVDAHLEVNTTSGAEAQVRKY
jgi:hypothetical protein